MNENRKSGMNNIRRWLSDDKIESTEKNITLGMFAVAMIGFLIGLLF